MRLWRYCLAGLLFNWAAFVFWTVLPVRALDFQASSTELALLPTASSIVYVLNSLFSGGLSDRISRALLARVSVVIAVAACALAVGAGSLGVLFLIVPLMGFATSVYWPSIQGALGSEAGPGRVERVIGWFNVSWSVGKTLGFVMGGWLVAQSASRTLWMAAASAVPVLFLYPRDLKSRPKEPHPASIVDRAAFRTLGYVVNFFAFGVGAVFQNQFIKYLESSKVAVGWDPKIFFGAFLGAIYAAQTGVFVVLQRGAAWTYRRGLLYACQILCGGAALAAAMLTTDWAILGAGALVGVGLGFANASSIYYSLHGPSDHGKYAGLHEAILGAGSFLAPLAGGALADHTHDLRHPYWLAGSAMIAAIALEELLYRRSSTS